MNFTQISDADLQVQVLDALIALGGDSIPLGKIVLVGQIAAELGRALGEPSLASVVGVRGSAASTINGDEPPNEAKFAAALWRLAVQGVVVPKFMQEPYKTASIYGVLLTDRG